METETKAVARSLGYARDYLHRESRRLDIELGLRGAYPCVMRKPGMPPVLCFALDSERIRVEVCEDSRGYHVGVAVDALAMRACERRNSDRRQGSLRGVFA